MPPQRSFPPPQPEPPVRWLDPMHMVYRACDCADVVASGLRVAFAVGPLPPGYSAFLHYASEFFASLVLLLIVALVCAIFTVMWLLELIIWLPCVAVSASYRLVSRCAGRWRVRGGGGSSDSGSGQRQIVGDSGGLLGVTVPGIISAISGAAAAAAKIKSGPEKKQAGGSGDPGDRVMPDWGEGERPESLDREFKMPEPIGEKPVVINGERKGLDELAGLSAWGWVKVSAMVLGWLALLYVALQFLAL